MFHWVLCYAHLCNSPVHDHNILYVSIAGNLGIFRPELFVLPESEAALSDNGKLLLTDINNHKQFLTATSYLCVSSILGRNRI